MGPLKALRSVLMRVGDGSEGKYGMSQEYNIGGGQSYLPQRESLALGSPFLVITHALSKILKTNFPERLLCARHWSRLYLRISGSLWMEAWEVLGVKSVLLPRQLGSLYQNAYRSGQFRAYHTPGSGNQSQPTAQGWTV